MQRPISIGKRIAFASTVYLVGLLMLEGLSSFAWSSFSHGAPPPRSLAELRHSTYDPDLGWAHIPNLYVEDMYGKGIYLKTNSQGLRSSRDFAQQVPEGRIRVVCSGDSFTLGYGVSNDETWCQQLTGFDARIETVNMGQGGYGLDQAYLWYLRDGEALEHDVLIFAFISEDLQRMRVREFVGYGKPRLRLVDGKLVVGNQPVPEMVRLFRSAHYSVHGNQYIAKGVYSGLVDAKVLAGLDNRTHLGPAKLATHGTPLQR